MALRPAAHAAVRALLRRPERVAAAATSVGLRALSTSPAPRAWLGRSDKKDDTPSPSPPADDDLPLTDFQQKIAALETRAIETRADADPEPQVALLRALAQGGEYRGLIGYYESIALQPPPDGSDALVKSAEAFDLYADAIAHDGSVNELVIAVRRRDARLAALGLAPEAEVPKEVQAAAAALGATPAAAAAAAAAAAPAAPSPAPAAPSPAPAAAATPTPAADPAPAPSKLSSIFSAFRKSPKTAEATTTTAGVISQPGSPLHPLHVQIAEAPKAGAWRNIRWLLAFLLWTFLGLTILSLVMENSGLLKTAGGGPKEFEPEESTNVKFSDVLGVEEAKGELEEIVEFLRNPEKFSKLGGKLPRGVLLTGPPGTGKTLLARAVAGEAGVPFLFASGSSFDELYVGVGAKRVRELFKAARTKAPAIIFIDELDAIGSKRNSKDQQYLRQTLNQLLVELDGFQQSEGVIIIAATNIPQSLDPALTRPGRFDRHVVVPLPDVRGRIAILKHHMGDIAIDPSVDPSVIARGTPGMSGADLQNLCNQAAIKASRDGADTVNLNHFEWAKDRILMGAERRSHYVTEDAKLKTAYHEAGHALVALHTPGAMPLHKVTVMPRGPALGLTYQLPEADKDSYSRKEYNAMIDVSLGGRAAEELILGEDDTTSGCSSDLSRATEVANSMIRSFGFSDKVGLAAHSQQDQYYLSESLKKEMESEVKGFLDKGMGRVRSLLSTHRGELDTLAKALVEYETLDADEVKKVLSGQKLDRPGASEGAALRSETEISHEHEA
ncbi:i-AAA protease yme1 [Vanrija albida]|uniref:I-AAA protease yme1 n=1 Tax=Vanrija albida TaxID=181172 RepID=A0ABR3QCH1_9TREE